ncbi:MAG: tetratricopeptide repeat protein [Bacteroidia bacterium]
MFKHFLVILTPFLLAASGAFAQKAMADRLVDRVLAGKEYKEQQKQHIEISDSLDKIGAHTLHYHYLDTLINKTHKINRRLEAMAVMAMGNFYLGTGNNYSSLEMFRKALELYETDKNYNGLTNVYTNMGNTYFYSGELEKALLYYKKAISCNKKSTGSEKEIELRLANIYNNIGGVYCTKTDYVFGRTYLGLAMNIWAREGDSLSIGYSYNNFARIFLDTKQLDSAIYYYKKALPLKMRFGSVLDKADAHEAIGAYYLEMKKPKEALAYFEKGLTFLDTTLPNRQLINCYMGCKNAFHEMNDCGNELKYFKLLNVARDSSNGRAQQANIARRELQFEFSKIHLADSIKTVQEIKLKDVKLSEKKKESYFLIIVLLLTFAALSLIYSRFKLTKKQKHIIEEQKLIVDEKNKEIIESINYAKRLQEAILPPLAHVKEVLPQSFVIYQPKDIVAGDFYWMHVSSESVVQSPEKKVPSSGLRTLHSQLIFIAAADCTGHGVPGAMVSVVCSNALNRAVKEFGLTDPGLILDKVRELVIETFEKSENDVKDGMDISLLVIDKAQRLVKWSGAHNRLLYMQNALLNEIKADRQPIGKSDHLKKFTTHEISYADGTVFYLFTDGIIDQFGGANAKKFTINNFKNLLQSISDMDVTKQYAAIMKQHEDWKGRIEQIDDITVIGIKL